MLDLEPVRQQMQVMEVRVVRNRNEYYYVLDKLFGYDLFYPESFILRNVCKILNLTKYL